MRKTAETTVSYRITDLDEDDRPRERLEKHGADKLSNPELLAILLRVGIPGENAVQLATRLLNDLGGLYGIQRATFQEVCEQRGLGAAKAAQIKAALELGNRMRWETIERRAIQSPSDAFDVIASDMAGLDHEELWVLLLDTRNKVIEKKCLYKGSLNASPVRVGEVFRQAIQRNAAAIVVAHNHPSGDPTPSPEDVAMTRAMVQAGRMLDIEVLDHVVVGQGRWVSMKNKGQGF